MKVLTRDVSSPEDSDAPASLAMTLSHPMLTKLQKVWWLRLSFIVQGLKGVQGKPAPEVLL